MAKLIKKEFIKKNYNKDKFVLLYDLEVEKDESYIANGIIVHNSHCDVCPIYAKRKWTWETLPTTPGAGDTPCIVSGRIGIYTSKGLKRISRIKPGDLVLTHKGRFRKVVKTQKTPYTEEVLQFKILVGDEEVGLTVTPDHKFMVGVGVWKCPQCGKTFFLLSDYFKECCSLKCSNKYYDKKRIQAAHNKNYIYIENEAVVKNIKALKGRKRFRYDLEVEEDHSYLTRGGVISKNCLFRCHCHLEFKPRGGKKFLDLGVTPGIPGSASEEALTSPGRWAQVFDSQGRPVRGVFAQDIEELYQRMYKARQMITLGVDKRKWIELRRDLNKEVIALTKEKGYRAVPSVSVSELVATIKSVQAKGGVFVPEQLFQNNLDCY